MSFDRSKLILKPLNSRIHDLDMSSILPLNKVSCVNPFLSIVADRIIEAKSKGSSVILMAGGHVIRSGIQRYLIDLMEKGYISCIAMNGSGIIHDFEFALIGATTESVSRYITEGQFGLWKETSRLNDIINDAHKENLGMGYAVGRAIQDGDFLRRDISILSAGYRLNIPVTIHVGIGYDIIHEYPNFDGAAAGATSYKDFLTFADIVQRLETGVVMNFGSAVMAPEVFLKALSMSRNIAHQKNKSIRKFTTLVCDLLDLPVDFSKEPSRDSPAYYFRPWKTMLVRTVADGGSSLYVKGRHVETMPELWTSILEQG